MRNVDIRFEDSPRRTSGIEDKDIDIDLDFANIQSKDSDFLSSFHYLAHQEHICRGSSALAYFGLAESLIRSEYQTHYQRMGGSRESVRNATKNFLLLGEAQIHNCKANVTTYHHLRAEWRYWASLGRIERMRVLPELFASEKLIPEKYIAPPASFVQNRRKWTRKKHASFVIHGSESVSSPSESEKVYEHVISISAPGGSKERPCFRSLQKDRSKKKIEEHEVHVAFSADKKQLDGLVVALNSISIHTADPTNTCVHVFVQENEMETVRHGLQCAFGEKFSNFDAAYRQQGFWLQQDNASDIRSDSSGSSPVFLHIIPEDLVSNSISDTATTRRYKVGGDTDVSAGFQKDVGNLQALHNYVRFYLHRLLPVDKIIYLDVDVVIKRDIGELWNEFRKELDVSEATVCTVTRPSSPLFNYIPGVLYPFIPEWIPMNNAAFNAGVLPLISSF